MDRWVGKVAVVTGASAGIGAAIAIDLVRAGLIVVGLARRKERVDALLNDIPENERRGKLYSYKMDISKDEEVNEAFQWIEAEIGAVHILINNAGIFKMTSITSDDNNEELLKSVLQTNLWGLILSTKRAVTSMKKHNVISGHIVNINSIAGHKVIKLPSSGNGDSKPQVNLYPSSKFGVTAVTEVLRQEFNFDKLKTKITSISPGAVLTEIGFDENTTMTPEFVELFEKFSGAYLQPVDVSNAVLYVLATPPNVQVHELTIKPNGESF